MRILWFTNTPSNVSAKFGYTAAGGGWISALETLLSKEQTHNLGICFFYSGNEYKRLMHDNVTYYAIPYKRANRIKRILGRQLGLANDDSTDYFDKVIDDFKPEIIHVFGTESGYGKILINKFDKVVFHLQGLIKPSTEVYFPRGITIKSVLRSSNLGSILRGLTFYHGYLDLKTRAKREVEIIGNWKYFSGRTHWDHNYIALLNPTATYFHCNELLREEFFRNHWSVPLEADFKKNVVIGTTMNASIYKGLDLIYKVIPLLKDYNIIWKIFGLTEAHELNKVVKKSFNKGQKNNSIQFHGSLGATELISALKTCHFFVHPSYIDNSPNSVCEAQLLGMPVLSSSVGGVSSLIKNNYNGFLFNPYDRFDLAGLLASLIIDYPKALIAAKQARCTALERHSPEGILKTVNTMYNTICND